MDIVDKLREFLENEARSCSMDFGCVTPEYLFRSWGGSIAMDEIATGLTETPETRNPGIGNMKKPILLNSKIKIIEL